MDYIPLEKCQHGYLYKIHSRNLDYGVFNQEPNIINRINGFIGIRMKFENRYLFTELHHDTGAPFGTVFPIEEIEKIPDGIEIIEYTKHSVGDSWAVNPETQEVEPVLRRDLVSGELPHGKRQGFVDLWVKNGKRLPDNLYPYLRENKELFDYLDKFVKGKHPSEEKVIR